MAILGMHAAKGDSVMALTKIAGKCAAMASCPGVYTIEGDEAGDIVIIGRSGLCSEAFMENVDNGTVDLTADEHPVIIPRALLKEAMEKL